MLLNKNKKIMKFIIISIFVDIILASSIVLLTYFFSYKLSKRNVLVPTLSPAEGSGLNIKTADIFLEDWKDKFKDKFSEKVVVTENSYKSKNVSIDITKNEIGSGNDKITYYLADIYISNITCFKTEFAKNTYGLEYDESLEDMSTKTNAILAINGDSYNGEENIGTIIRNGIIYNDKTTKTDVCVLYKNGEMKTYSKYLFDTQKVISNGAYQTWSFGPTLLDENGKKIYDFKTWEYLKKRHPRTAIGYYEPGHYAFLVVDGRDTGYSKGMTLEELSALFKNLGCKVAYNLDGGKSSSMLFMNNVVNNLGKQGRNVNNGIFIVEDE